MNQWYSTSTDKITADKMIHIAEHSLQLFPLQNSK